MPHRLFQGNVQFRQGSRDPADDHGSKPYGLRCQIRVLQGQSGTEHSGLKKYKKLKSVFMFSRSFSVAVLSESFDSCFFRLVLVMPINVRGCT